jgi:hypothetical protein
MKMFGGGSKPDTSHIARQQELIAKQEADIAQKEREQDAREKSEQDALEAGRRGFRSLLAGGYGGFEENTSKLGTRKV